MQFWAFLSKNVTLKPASHFLHNSLAILVRHSQAQKCLQSDPKPFQQVSTEFKNFLFNTEDFILTDEPTNQRTNEPTTNAFNQA